MQKLSVDNQTAKMIGLGTNSYPKLFHIFFWVCDLSPYLAAYVLLLLPDE